MNFYQKYELERLIADGETKTFRAIENATGRAVYLHFFNPEGLGLLTALKFRFAKGPGKPELPLIELGEFAGTPYAVTLPIEQFSSVRRWMDALGESGSKAQAGPLEDLTVEMPKPAPAPIPPPQTEPRPAVKAARPVAPAPGEFTRLFESPKNPPAAPPTQSPQAGEFTRLFESPKNPPAASPTQSPQAGEFTRLFESPKNPPAAPPTQSPQAGEFTRLFEGAPQQPRSSPQPARSSPADAGDFTQLFGAPPPVRSEPPLRSEPPRPPDPPRAAEPPKPMPKVVSVQPPRVQEPVLPPRAPSWPASSPSDETGQFTKLFGSGPSGEAINIEEEQARAAQRAQPESRPFQAPTAFTRVFGPEESVKLRQQAPPRTDSASGIFGSIEEVKTAAPTRGTGPGEYTRVTSRAELEAEQAALGGASSAGPAPVRRGLILGLAIGAMLLLVLVIVILILASKK